MLWGGVETRQNPSSEMPTIPTVFEIPWTTVTGVVAVDDDGESDMPETNEEEFEAREDVVYKELEDLESLGTRQGHYNAKRREKVAKAEEKEAVVENDGETNAEETDKAELEAHDEVVYDSLEGLEGAIVHMVMEASLHDTSMIGSSGSLFTKEIVAQPFKVGDQPSTGSPIEATTTTQSSPYAWPNRGILTLLHVREIYIRCNLTMFELTSVDNALQIPEWRATMAEELDMINNNNTWVLVPSLSRPEANTRARTWDLG
uniref:Uncharacterized protein n=1 Tax=Solanum tuberosum TaxID=4113 RepID=M1DHV5_SOLTU